MRDGISLVLLGILIFSISYISEAVEQVKRVDRKLDKIVKSLGLDIDENIDDELKEIIIKEGKIKAIKRYREHTGVGLKESKEYIDNLHININENKE